MIDVGERIKQLRDKRNWSLRELETRTGINYSVLSRIETGKRSITDEEINIFSNLFNVTSDYLLGRTDNPDPHNKVTVAGQEITLTREELKVFEELKKHPIMFNDLASDPEKKIKELIKLYKMKKMFLEEDDEEYGVDGFGDLED